MVMMMMTVTVVSSCLNMALRSAVWLSALCVGGSALRFPVDERMSVGSSFTVTELMYATDEGPLGLTGASTVAATALGGGAPVAATLSALVFESALRPSVGVWRGEEVTLCCSFDLARLGLCAGAREGARRGRVVARGRRRAPRAARAARVQGTLSSLTRAWWSRRRT